MTCLHMRLHTVVILHYACSSGEEWQKIKSAGTRPVYARRVGNMTEPLCEIADDLVAHIEKIRDPDGNVHDVLTETMKWAFAGNRGINISKHILRITPLALILCNDMI